MKPPKLSRRLLLGSLLAVLTGWLGACQTRTAAPPRQATASSDPQREERGVQALTALQTDGLGISVIYTYDDQGNCISVQRSENPPAEPSARISDSP